LCPAPISVLISPLAPSTPSTPSLHDALPIYWNPCHGSSRSIPDNLRSRPLPCPAVRRNGRRTLLSYLYYVSLHTSRNKVYRIHFIMKTGGDKKGISPQL